MESDLDKKEENIRRKQKKTDKNVLNDKYQMNRNEINSNNNIEFILFYFRRKWKKNNVPIFDRNIRLIIELKQKQQ